LTCIGIAFAPSSRRSRALASDSGLPQIWAPVASAENSRWREIASWIRLAAMGARITSASEATRLRGELSSPPNHISM